MSRAKPKKHYRRLLPVLLILCSLAAALFLYEPAPDYAEDGRLRICIDAGHGGDDPGAADLAGTRLEKDDCLAMALAVEAVLAEKYPGIEVLLTRSEDVYLELQERCDLAEDFRADLFLSIHRNSAQGAASGIETWIPAGKLSADKALAEAVQKGLRSVGVTQDRGVKSGTAGDPKSNYYVLGHTAMPSCLIELGFMTSAEDNLLLDQHFDEYAAAIADAAAGLLLE